MRRIFSTVFGPQEPALTAGSFAINATGRPADRPHPGDNPIGPEALLLPVGEQPLLGERVGVEQPRDPLPDRQLLLLRDLLAMSLRAALQRGVEGRPDVAHNFLN